MSYLVSARKFRPQTFGSIVGQDHVSIPLANAIARNRVPHALLLTGPRGVGKTSCARVFAKALNCTGRSIDSESLKSKSSKEARDAVEPCGKCANCDEIARSCSIAVREIDGASNNSVDNVRELIESLRSLPPPGSTYKMYIIDEVHMLSTAAFNALLKSLEEPPPNTIFVFATTEPHKIPETVISRCQRYDFRALTPEAIAAQLGHIAESEGLKVGDDVLRLISRKAQGGMRDAQSMFDRLLAFGGGSVDLQEAQRLFGVVDRDFFLRLSESILQQNAASCFELIEEVFSHSIDFRTFAGDFLSHWRDMMLLVYAVKESSSESALSSVAKLVSLNDSELERARTQISNQSVFDAQRLFDISEQTVRTALSSTFPRYVLEAGIAKMASLPDLQPVPELIDRLERLESGGAAIPAAARSAAAPSISKPAVKNKVPSPEQPPEPRKEYNPSWRDFVAHVQGRGEPVLSAHLRRVSPNSFVDGQLTLSAAPFDKDALAQGDLFDKLRRCLHSYSGNESWTIRFDDQPTPDSAGDKPAKGTNGAVQGSLAEQERRAEASRRAKIDREARNDPTVQSVLSAFSGSKVEKVSPLK
ncbi:MAG: DNA polymerase III subunit gamma/tau [Bdellovibrionales bacterium]|nr:DNA polymerase III subunit gamma/tau [Bdellovibrionales bacterium]